MTGVWRFKCQRVHSGGRAFRFRSLALGGWHLGLPKTERESTRLVHAALDGGITFMDNAWDYNEGVSETRMGKALVGRRDKVFLMTKSLSAWP